MASNEIECHLCRNAYNSSENRPKILPCSHTFCKKCIHELCHDDNVKCPTCCQEINRRDLIAITTDFATLELIDKATDSSDKDKANNESSFITSDTKANSFEDCESNEQFENALEHVPEVDNKPEISDRLKETLQENLEWRFQEAATASTEVREALTQQYEGLRASRDAAVGDIDADFDRLIQMLQRRRKLLKQQLTSQYEDKLAEMEENLETVTLNSMRLESLHKHTDILMTDDNNSHNLQVNAEKIECEISELLEPLKLIDLATGQFCYESGSHMQNLDKSIRSLGRVNIVSHDLENM